jgi:hypothetical protein
MIKTVFTSLLVWCLLAPSAFSASDDSDWIKDTSDIGRSNNGVIRSDQFLELGVASASCLQLEGEASLRQGNLDRAITVLQKSVEQAPLDMDKRILYAGALEKKLMMQEKRDPRLFNFIVKQWLFVVKKSEFVDQSAQGRGHLMNLVGRAPRMWEKPSKYLAQVLIPEDDSQEVVLGKKQIAEK